MAYFFDDYEEYQFVLNQQQVNELEEKNRKMSMYGAKDRILEELEALNKKLDGLASHSVNSNLSPPKFQFVSCALCGENGHCAQNCGMQVPYERGYYRNNVFDQGNCWPKYNYNPYSNSFDSGWKNNHDFSWEQNGQQTQWEGDQWGNFQNRDQFQNQGYNCNNEHFNWENQGNGSYANESDVHLNSNLEKMLEAFIVGQKQVMDERRNLVELLATQNELLRTKLAQQTQPLEHNKIPMEVMEIHQTMHKEDQLMPFDDEEEWNWRDKEEEKASSNEQILPTEVEASTNASPKTKLMPIPLTFENFGTITTFFDGPNPLLKDEPILPFSFYLDASDYIPCQMSNGSFLLVQDEPYLANLHYCTRSVSYKHHWKNYDAFAGRKVKVKCDLAKEHEPQHLIPSKLRH
jgi:hypothetical protein